MPILEPNRVPRFVTGRAILIVAVITLLVVSASAQPVIVESDWTLLRSVSFDNPWSAIYNPVDGYVYLGQREADDGLFRLDQYGLVVQISEGSNTASVCVDPLSGDVFQSEGYGGVIYRTALGTTGREAWVSGFHAGDDDPTGITIAPYDYVGDVLAPGEALVVDRGSSNPDEIWIWSPLTAEGEILLHADDGTLINGVDLAINATSVFVVDDAWDDPGAIYEVGAGGTLTPLVTSEPLADPGGVTFDPWTGDLLVLDYGVGRVVRVDPITGQVSDVITGLSTEYGWCCIDIHPDGRGLLVTDHATNLIHEFARCDGSGPGFADCDGNGVHDACDIALETLPDCNGNGIPDECDLDVGSSDDCNLDGVPDDCPLCPPVELIFVMDTSASMDNEASALCGNMDAMITTLNAAGLEVQPLLLGICEAPGGAYDCLENHVANLLGTDVPGSPPPGLEILGACPGGSEVCSEDWGLATAVVAGLYTWQPADTSVRLIVPLFDEGAWCGDPVDGMDDDAVIHATIVARDNDVIVSPITASGSSASVLAHAQAIADATGGQSFSSAIPSQDIAQGLVDIVLAACTAYTDCNENGVFDECDLASGTSLDENEDGVPDECESVAVDRLTPRARILSVTNHPNPFNPRTHIEFELAAGGPVRLDVFDAAGALVRTLLDNLPRSAGVHGVDWDGTDDRERRAPAGVYFYRLLSGDETAVGRMALVK